MKIVYSLCSRNESINLVKTMGCPKKRPVYSKISISKDNPVALRVRISQKFAVEFEQRILTVIALYHPIASFSCADAFKPVTHCAVQLVIDGCEKWQQACEIYSEVSEVRVILIAKIDETDIEIAGTDIAVKEEAEAVVLVHEVVIVRFHRVCPFIL